MIGKKRSDSAGTLDLRTALETNAFHFPEQRLQWMADYLVSWNDTEPSARDQIANIDGDECMGALLDLHLRGAFSGFSLKTMAVAVLAAEQELLADGRKFGTSNGHAIHWPLYAPAIRWRAGELLRQARGDA